MAPNSESSSGSNRLYHSMFNIRAYFKSSTILLPMIILLTLLWARSDSSGILPFWFACTALWIIMLAPIIIDLIGNFYY